MLDNIVVPSVGGADASNALEYAIRLARLEEARINLLTIIPSERVRIKVPGPWGIYTPILAGDAPVMIEERGKAEKSLKTLAHRCEEANVPYSAQVLVAPLVSQLLNTASLMDIIVAQRSESWAYSAMVRFFDIPWPHIVRRSRCPLLLLPEKPATLENAVVVHDWTLKSGNAVRRALKLAALLNLSLRILVLKGTQKRGLIRLPHPNLLLQGDSLTAGVQIKEVEKKGELYQELERLRQVLPIISARRRSFLWGIGHQFRRHIKDASGAVCIVP